MADNISETLAGGQVKTITYGNIQIRGHLLRLPDIVIQISNISGITISEITTPNLGVIAIFFGVIMGLAGGIVIKLSEHYSYYSGTYYDENFLAFGIITAGVGIALVWYGIRQWRKGSSKTTYLNIHLNSGMRYAILFSNESFMKKVLDVFANIFDSGGTAMQEYNINIKNCEFIGGAGVNTGTINN